MPQLLNCHFKNLFLILGDCPRIEAVVRESGFELIFLIKLGEYLLYLTNLIGKMGQNLLFRSRPSILGQPHKEPSLVNHGKTNATQGR